MADNYLEKKMEEHKALPDRKSFKATKKSRAEGSLPLDSLLIRNRSCRGYDSNYIVSKEELLKIVEVNTKIASARNQQVLRFRLVYGTEAKEVTKAIKLGGALPELNLPLPGTEPNAYIIICTEEPKGKWVDIDLGISAQSMLLKAVDLGLNGICIAAFNKEKICALVNGSRQMEPLLILAIGKSIERFQLLPIGQDDEHNYFRKNGVHFVPKVRIEDLLIWTNQK
ncbi:MAG: nitroreductase family protein [Candidatus Egerieousia sp.]|nr:nitroreductase family protein [bacterium]MDY5256092.1 nitroreductase family protein [Candidatus Egerieousia sp.]